MKRIPFLLLFITSLLSILASIKYFNVNKTLHKTERSLELSELELKSIVERINIYRFYESVSRGQEISSDDIVEDLTGKLHSLNNLNLAGTLFLFIHPSHCSTCWGTALKRIINYYPDLIGDYFKVISSFSNFRDVVIPIKEMNKNIQVYNLKKDSLGLEIEALDRPFLMTFSYDKAIKDVIIIDEKMEEAIDSFINAFIKWKK